MKKLLAATFSFAALAVGAADAADLGVRRAAPAAVAVAPACANFGGVYIGAQGGWLAYQHRFNDIDGYGLAVSTVDNISSGRNTANSWHVGPQAGFNWQSGCAVFGVQVDWSWTNANAEALYFDVPNIPADGFATISSKMSWFGTARARTGIVVNDLMLYVTGGAAFAKFKGTHDLVGNGPAPTVTVTFDSTRVGFVVGAGTEWSFAGNWSFVSEFLYMGFQKDNASLVCPSVATCGGFPVGSSFRYDFSDSAWVGRVGLNYRFGGGAPVVARY